MPECTCGAVAEYWRTHNPEVDGGQGVVHSQDCQVIQKALYEEERDL